MASGGGLRYTLMKMKILIYLGKQRTKKEASQHTNQHNPAGHERKVKPTLNFLKYCKYTFLCIANIILTGTKSNLKEL